MVDHSDILGLAKKRTIRTGIIGSLAYGTDHENSDTDYRSIYIAPPRLSASPFLNLNLDEIKDPNEEDSIYWELGSFLSNAPMSPSMLDLMFIRDSLCAPCSIPRLEQKIIDHRESFLSRPLVFRLLGHASRDLKRMRRDDVVPSLKSKPNPLSFMYKDQALKKPLGRNFFENSNGEAVGRIIFETKDSKSKVATISYYPDVDAPLLNAEGDLIKNRNRPDKSLSAKLMFFDMKNFKRHVTAYNNRASGPAKTSKRHDLFSKHGFDTKTAASALRLSRMALELAQNGTYNLFREDADELKSIILDGSRTADSIEAECLSLKKAAYEAAPESILREEPDWGLIERLYSEIMQITHPDRVLDRKTPKEALDFG